MNRPVRVAATLVLALLTASSAAASVSVRRSAAKQSLLDVTIVREPLSVAVAALEIYLPERVELAIDGDPPVTLRAREIAPIDALRRLAASARLAIETRGDGLVVRSPREATVTLDVKDADARVILKSMQRQCGIRNLMINPEVQGAGTFLFRDVPCRTAFSVVLRSLGLSSVVYSPEVTLIEARVR